jgi:hypothetical protein
MLSWHKLAVVASVSLGLGPGAALTLGQSAPPRPDRSSDVSEGTNGAAADRRNERRPIRTITGTVERTKQVDLRRNPSKELVILLRTDDGSKHIVDLGTTRALGSQKARTGDKVTVRGRMASLGKYQVLVARTLQQGERQYTIRRPLNPPVRPYSYAVANQTRTIRGRLLNKRQVNLRDSEVDHVVGRIRDGRGRQFLVDFGKSTNANVRSMQPGDAVTVNGRNMLVDRRNVILAFQVTGADDETFRIAREGMPTATSR